MDRTASALGITIVGGHTELTPGLTRPIVITTAFAFASSYVTAADAKAGDSILITKSAGVEGTGICASDPSVFHGKVEAGVLRRAKGFFRKLSVVDEAAAAYATGAVHAMHDCTEGGVLGAVFEMSRASGMGFELRESAIPVAVETAKVCAVLKLDPLRLISSGTLLIAVEAGREEEVRRAVKEAGSKASVVGRFRRGRRELIHEDGSIEEIEDAPTDELWKLIGRQGM
jgi:hydrogenase maturation factor